MTADVIIKTTNIPGIAHSGLSIPYDFSKRQATAFAYGYDAVLPVGSPEKDQTLSKKYRAGLENITPLWQHPLILPVILLKHELAMIRKISRVQLKPDRTDVWVEPLSNSYKKTSELLAGNRALRTTDEAGVDPMENLNH